jgi:3-hydroxyisobutyrate dehydrogenase-like beta-hydroxyacid dehydrogenase
VTSATAVAVIGIGRIGLPLTTRLVAAGFDVIAHDVRRELSAAARDTGAEWADTAEGAVAATEVAITALPGTPELQQLMLSDAGGLLTRWPAGTVWIDLTSTAPDVAEQLAEMCRRHGVDYVAAPLGGGAEAMRGGGVELYVGGEPDVLERVRPVIRAFARESGVRHLGDQRAACTAKLLVNAVWFGQAVLYTEALLLAQRLGIDPERMRATMQGGAADSEFVRRHLPALLAGNYLADFGIDRCVEELEAVVRLAEASGSPHDILADVTRLHVGALSEFGPVPGELLAAALLERRAGVSLHEGHS